VLYADVKRQYDRAIRDFDKAIALDPMYAEAYESRAIAYYLQGEYALAWIKVYQAQASEYQVSPAFLEGLRKASGGAR
jgi:lipoprotein NlpI